MKLILILILIIPQFSHSQTPGTLDPLFNGTGMVTTSVGITEDRGYDIEIQSSGKIVVGGFSNVNGKAKFALIRYLLNGQIDSTFGNNGITITSFNTVSDDKIWSIAIQNDDKIVAVGETRMGTIRDIAIARYDINGFLDPTFGSNGKVIRDFFNRPDIAYSVDISYPSGRIYVGGWTGINIDVLIMCLDSGGALDLYFNTTGFIIKDLGYAEYLYSLKIFGDSLLYCGGERIGLTNPELLTMAFKSNGIIDSSYNTIGYNILNLGYSVAGIRNVNVQPDQRLLFGGFIGTNSSLNDFIIGRYLPNGTLDSTFSSDGYLIQSINSRDVVSDIVLQSDGKIIVGGYTLNSVSGFNFALLRLTTDGSIDLGFGSNGFVQSDFNSTDDNIFGMTIQTDSKILVCGQTFQNNKWNFAAARYFSGLEVGISEFDSKYNNIQIFPNPVSGNEINFNTTLSNTTIKLMALNGTLIKVYHDFSGDNLKLVPDLSDGIYVIHIIEKLSATTKLLTVLNY